MKIKTMFRLLDKYGLQFDSETDSYGNMIYRVWPFISDVPNSRHGLTPSKSFSESLAKVRFAVFKNSDYVSNFTLNRRQTKQSITEVLKLLGEMCNYE